MRIWRVYTVSLLACLFVTALGCGLVTADVNTRTVVKGEGGAVAAGSQRENAITLSVDERTFRLEIPEYFNKFAMLLPAPIGNLIALPECMTELIESYL